MEPQHTVVGAYSIQACVAILPCIIHFSVDYIFLTEYCHRQQFVGGYIPNIFLIYPEIQEQFISFYNLPCIRGYFTICVLRLIGPMWDMWLELGIFRKVGPTRPAALF